MEVIMGIRGEDVDTKMPIEIRVPTVAYDAEMVCDMIVSYT